MNDIYVTKAFLPSFQEYIDEIKSIWDTHRLSNMGPKHDELQESVRNYLGVEHLDLFTNGHMALELALQAYTLQGEVITTPYTFASTTHAIVRNDLTPVFCDVNEDDFTIDVSKIETLITEKTSAIVPVHVYGNICDVDSIDTIAKKYGLKVIYDAAHAFGVRYKGKGIGAYGDASCFSFHATKVFNTIEGGAVAYTDSMFGDKIYQLKNFGIQDEETVNGVGANAKLNEFCAAMGICNIRYIDEIIAERKEISECYKAELSGIRGISYCKEQMYVDTNFSYFPIVIAPEVVGISRNELFNMLEAEGVHCRKYFYPIANEFECYKKCNYREPTPIAKKISENVITLPIYPGLNTKKVEEICHIIKRACK